MNSSNQLSPTTKIILALQQENTYNDVSPNATGYRRGMAMSASQNGRNQAIVHALSRKPTSQINTSFDFLKSLNIPSVNQDIQTGRLTPDRWNTLIKSTDKTAYTAKNNVNLYPHYTRGGNFTDRKKAPIHVINFKSPYYPKNLLHARNKNGDLEFPPVLYAQGNVKALNQKAIAIVGARKTYLYHRNGTPNKDGQLTQKYAQYFSHQGFSEVGGLAFGADTIAQNAANQAGGHTIAILANGLDQGIYPKSNAKYAEDTLNRGGALVSAVPLNHRGSKSEYISNLIKRDQWQAGMSNGVIAVKAGVYQDKYGHTRKSGTRHAMNWANVMHRPVGVPNVNKYKQKFPYDFGPANDFAIINDFIKSGKAKAMYTGRDVYQFQKSVENNIPKGRFTAAQSQINKSIQHQTTPSPAPQNSNSGISNAFNTASKNQRQSSQPQHQSFTDSKGNLNKTYLMQKVDEASKNSREQTQEKYARENGFEK